MLVIIRQLLAPPGLGGLPSSHRALTGREFFGPASAALTAAKLTCGNCCRVLRFLGWWAVLNLPRRDPHDMDGVAYYIGGALLAFGATGHRSNSRLAATTFGAKALMK